MNTRDLSEHWSEHQEHIWRREDTTGTIDGYLLREGLPATLSGAPSRRLARGWERYAAAGVVCWWRIDGPEEEWRPAGVELRRSAEHVEWHAAALELAITDPEDAGPCPECALIEQRARDAEADNAAE